MGRGRAPGKVILLGEHAVVYGRTALAASIDRYVAVEIARAGSLLPSHTQNAGAARDAVPLPALRRAAQLAGLELDGMTAIASADLPMSVGLGSSAALSVALIRALAHFAGQSLRDATVCARAFEIEKLFHGFPSGIDNTVVTYGGLIAFRRDASVRPLHTARPVPLVIALGAAPRQTQRAVRSLRERWEARPGLYEPMFDEIDRLASDAEQAIAAGDLAGLGKLMDANHRLLQRMRISTDELDAMVALARGAGALGAKLTGGGGGGAVICVCDGDRAALMQSFMRAGWRAFSADITQPGGETTHDAGRFEQRHSASA